MFGFSPSEVFRRLQCVLSGFYHTFNFTITLPHACASVQGSDRRQLCLPCTPSLRLSFSPRPQQLFYTLGKDNQLSRGNTREFYWLWEELLIGRSGSGQFCVGVTSRAAVPGEAGSTWRSHLCSRSLLCHCCCRESGFPSGRGAALDLGCKQGREALRKRPPSALRGS